MITLIYIVFYCIVNIIWQGAEYINLMLIVN